MMTDYANIKGRFEDIQKRSAICDEYWSELNILVQQVHVPKNTIIDSRPFEPEDFLLTTKAAKIAFASIQFIVDDVLKSVAPAESSQKFLDCIYSVVVLCGEHSSASFLWTDEECVKLSDKVLSGVLRLFGFDRFISFLMTTDLDERLHGVNIFSTLLAKLTTTTLKYYPATIRCYSWLLHHIRMPDMKEFAGLGLPVALTILSDYSVENKIMGLDCLLHITTNISKTELHWLIEVTIIQDILKPLLYFRESNLILPLIKCSLEIADKSKPGFKDAGVDLKWSFFDDVLNILLPMMEYEQDLKIRTVYASGLIIILESSNFAVGRWSKRFLFIIEDYTKTPATEVEAVKALNYYIRVCWPLAKNHWKIIAAIAGRAIVTCHKAETIPEAETSLMLLKELLPDETELKNAEYFKSIRRKGKVLNELGNSCEDITCQQYFKNI